MKKSRTIAVLAGAALASLTFAGCAPSGGSSGSSGGAKALTIEDYYQAPYNPIYEKCAKQVGNPKLTITHVAGAGLIAKVLQQASSRTLPDVLMLDNPDIQQIAATGALNPLDDYGINADGYAAGPVAAATYDGKLYGLQPGANTLAIFYNKDILDKA